MKYLQHYILFSSGILIRTKLRTKVENDRHIRSRSMDRRDLDSKKQLCFFNCHGWTTVTTVSLLYILVTDTDTLSDRIFLVVSCFWYTNKVIRVFFESILSCKRVLIFESCCSVFLLYGVILFPVYTVQVTVVV